MSQVPTPRLSAQPPYPAVQIANTFIDRYSGDQGITHMKVQKLVFYTYGWWIALMKDALPVSDSKPQVWKLGPVFYPIYSMFSKFKNNKITEMQPIGPFSAPSSITKKESAESQMIDWIWTKYGHFSALELSDMTHEPGTPWYNIAQRHNFEVPQYIEMEDDEIRLYFSELAQKEGLI